MKKKHTKQPKKRIEIGVPYENAIETMLMPKTNTSNLSANWGYTDWVRYAIVQQLKRAGDVPADCLAMLPRFDADMDL